MNGSFLLKKQQSLPPMWHNSLQWRQRRHHEVLYLFIKLFLSDIFFCFIIFWHTVLLDDTKLFSNIFYEAWKIKSLLAGASIIQLHDQTSWSGMSKQLAFLKQVSLWAIICESKVCVYACLWVVFNIQLLHFFYFKLNLNLCHSKHPTVRPFGGHRWMFSVRELRGRRLACGKAPGWACRSFHGCALTWRCSRQWTRAQLCSRWSRR